MFLRNSYFFKPFLCLLLLICTGDKRGLISVFLVFDVLDFFFQLNPIVADWMVSLTLFLGEGT